MAFDFASDVPPFRLAAPSIAGRGRMSSRAAERRRGMDAEAFSGLRPGMACLKTPPWPRSRTQGTVQSLFDWTAQTRPGRPFFGYFLVAAGQKVTRHQGGNFVQFSGGSARVNGPRASAIRRERLFAAPVTRVERAGASSIHPPGRALPGRTPEFIDRCFGHVDSAPSLNPLPPHKWGEGDQAAALTPPPHPPPAISNCATPGDTPATASGSRRAPDRNRSAHTSPRVRRRPGP